MELQILLKIKELTDLYTNQKIDVDNYIKEIKFDKQENKIVITAKQLGDDSEKNRLIEREVIKICKIDFNIKGVKMSYLPTDSDEPKLQISETTKVIAIMSGKGGVGKSNVAVGIAKALKAQGKKIGLIDADIYGYSIPALTDSISEPQVIEGKIMPVISPSGIEVISAHHFLPNTENKAIIWRGIKLNSLLNHFAYDVMWSKNLDYIVIDMPPGTGDVLLNIDNLFDQINSIYVTTPSSDAAFVAERVIQVGNELGFNNVGIVENMAYYLVDQTKHYIFGKDGAKTISEKYNLPIIGTLPISQKLTDEYNKLAKNITKLID